jgi:predicted ATPase
MIKRIRLQNFKNFQDAELNLGEISVLVGTNASGKSNIRDAFRFLHGISRGYQIAEIIGEKYSDGVMQWRGIRGGLREIMFYGSQNFAIEVDIVAPDPEPHPSATWNAGELLNFTYRIEIITTPENPTPRIKLESLSCDHLEHLLFKGNYESSQSDDDKSFKYVGLNGSSVELSIRTFRYIPILWVESESYFHEKVLELPDHLARHLIQIVLNALSDIRFFEFSPDAMRQPSNQGQTMLGDRGENLSSVMQDICQDPGRKEILLSWLQELTPMDARDFEFPSDFTGKILLHLVEENGHKTSAISASDGTLRFLGILAALLSAINPIFYFFEEPENGIHPTRLSLLMQLLEQEVARSQKTDSPKQVLLTTHAPLLLHYLSRENWNCASVVYRLPKHTESRITRILDLPDAERIAEDKTLGRLLESGWLEDTTYFLADEEVS